MNTLELSLLDIIMGLLTKEKLTEAQVRMVIDKRYHFLIDTAIDGIQTMQDEKARNVE